LRPEFILAALAAVAAPQIAAAQADPAAASGVATYPAAFFAPSQPNTAMDMINRAPGFSFDSGDSVRGFSGAGGNVLIDGERPATKSDDLESVLRRVPAAQVERIEVIRGGAPGIDMQGKTVLANVVRRKGDSVTGLISVVNHFTYDGRKAPGVRLEATRRGGGRTLEGSLVVAGFIDDGAGDGPRLRYDADGDLIGRWDVYTEGDGVQAIATGAYELPMFGGKVRVNGRAFNERFWYDEVAYGQYGTPDGLTERDNQKRTDGEVGLNYTRDLGPRTKLDLLGIQQLKKTDLFVKLQEEAEDLDAVFTIDRLTGESIGRATLAFTQSPALSFESGAEGAWNWLESETGFINNGEVVELPAANVRVEELRGEAFTKATWVQSPRLTVEAGLRAETSRISSEGDVSLEKTLSFVKPRGVVTWSPNPANQIRLRVEREVGQLNFDDFVAATEAGVVTSGNPDLNPEQAWVAEAAYERRFWTSGSVVLTVRHFEITDVIDRAPDPSGEFDAPANIGEGTRDELALTMSLPLDRLGVKNGVLRGESTWRRSEVTDPTTGELREISGEPPVEWEMRFTQGLPHLNVTWGVDVYGGFRETDYAFNEISTLKLRTFVLPYLEWKPRPDLSLRVEVPNITHRDLARIREVYDGPRDVSPLVFREAQELDNKPTLYVRIRKTFG